MVEHQQVVAEKIVGHVPDGWQKAWIKARVEEDYVGELTADYIDRGGEEHWFDLDDAGDVLDLSKALLAMRSQMRQADREPWSRCTFTLFPDGKFKLDVEYDD